MGTNNTNVRVNELDNNITGNSGINTVIFSGNLDEYTLSRSNNMVTVMDSQENRDGKVNTFKDIEKLQFLNETVNL